MHSNSVFADQLAVIAADCDEKARQIKAQPLHAIIDRITDAINDVARSSSNSWLGYQAHVYYKNFRSPATGDHFDSEWGLTDYFTKHVSDNWQEVSFETVHDFIMQKAGKPDTDALTKAADEANEVFEAKKEQLLTILTILLDQTKSAAIEEMRDEARKATRHSKSDVIKAIAPSGRMRSRDQLAMSQGLQAPHHLDIMAWLQACIWSFDRLTDLSKIARRAATFVSMQSKGAVRQLPSASEHRVFIGHGRSPLWKDLKDFIEDRLHLQWEEFNRESPAGKSTKERLEEMLKSSTFAFLLMTAEDEYSDATLHARENVIHEVGLFQGLLGFTRAIVLLESGCKEFSNIAGLGQIHFPKGHISGAFEEIRRVLEREGIIESS